MRVGSCRKERGDFRKCGAGRDVGAHASLKKLRWKPAASKLGEDPREAFVKKDDHGADALGYGLVAVPPPEVAPALPPRDPTIGIGAQTALKEWIGA